MVMAIDVARYLGARYQLSGEMQLQKIAYYVQGWSLAWTGQPLFDEPIEAWRDGPVIRSLRYCLTSPTAQSAVDKSIERLSAHDRAVIDAVWSYYGRLYGAQLSELTHSERPWIDARGQIPYGQHSSDEIPLSNMRRFYMRKAIVGDGPTGPSVGVVSASTEAALAAAARQADRWSETLEILGR